MKESVRTYFMSVPVSLSSRSISMQKLANPADKIAALDTIKSVTKEFKKVKNGFIA